MSAVDVAYEDQRGPAKEFGPHLLVLSLVCDAVGGNRWDLRPPKGPVREHVLKGNSKLLARLWALDTAFPKGARVVGVLDRDRVHEPLGLGASTDDEAIVKAIKSRCDEPDRLEVVLIKENLETILTLLRPHAGVLGLADEPFVGAIERKDRTDRDRIFFAAAQTEHRAVRDSLVNEVTGHAGLRRLRDLIVAAIR